MSARSRCEKSAEYWRHFDDSSPSTSRNSEPSTSVLFAIQRLLSTTSNVEAACAFAIVPEEVYDAKLFHAATGLRIRNSFQRAGYALQWLR